ncbi:hypothetical protein HZH68_001245 [Vespula germanica]|uniref:Uncharacterized protein n=1 Tax=Vespula germanica TaxID=30212 RepID=A0A834U6S3_VESGE|nr:hypothetical protein HZH68_001245 [Vespula germanica]
MPSCSFTTLKLCGPVVLRNPRLQDREALVVLFSPNNLRNVLSLECQSAFYYSYGFEIIEISFGIVELEGLGGNITKGMKSIVDIGYGGFADGHTRLKLPGRGH